MEKRRTALAAAICTFVLICLVGGSFLLSSASYQTNRYKVTLPSQSEETEDLHGSVVEEQPVGTFELPQFTPQNVQSVLAGLARPDEYVCTVTNTIHQNDKTSSWYATIYAKAEAQRIETGSAIGVVTEISLYYADRYAMWTPGSTSYWRTAAGTLTADMTAMIPSHQTVCTLPIETITHTERMDLEGEPCVLVEAEETEYVVSLVNGLLKTAKYYENGELVREVQITARERELEDALFVLPGESEPVFAVPN